MKIKSDISKNFLSIYDEARGVAQNRHKILKKQKVNNVTYLERVLFIFCVILLIGIYDIKLCLPVGYLLILAGTIYLVIEILRTYYNYIFRKNREFKSEIIINEQGIIDVSSFENVEILFKWETIKAIVIRKYSLTILTNSPVYFYFDIKDKNKISKAIKKYKKDIVIIKEDK